MKNKKALIIGGGFAGCSFAHLLSQKKGWDITLVEKTGVLGAGCRTHWYGGHPFTFGPRHFLTENEKVYEYLNKYCPLRDCSEHEFVTFVEQDQAFYNFPINRDDIPKMPDKEKIFKELEEADLAKSKVRFTPSGQLHPDSPSCSSENLEDFWKQSVGETLYHKFVENYTKKMWLVDDNRVIDDFGWSPKGVTIKDGGRESWGDAISAYPYAEDGYNKYFELATQGVHILYNQEISEYDIEHKAIMLNGRREEYDIIVNTISPDIIMNYEYGELPYIGRDLTKIILPLKEVLPGNTYFLYYAGEEKYTRIVEYKKLTKQKLDNPTTLISIEHPSKNGKYYPLPFKSEKQKAQKYFDKMPDGVFSIGRAGSYDYGVDIDDSIEQAMEIVRNI